MLTKKSQDVTVIDGITCFKPDIAEDYPDYHAAGLDSLYASEKEHFWFISRRERIILAFEKYSTKFSRIFEIGAGTGYVAQGLQKAGYKVAVGEIHLSGLRYAKKNGIKECYQLDLFSPPFQDEFDAIGMFDVLEHLNDDSRAVHEVSKMLTPGGNLYITVPAHRWLWSEDDEIAAHKRRYNKKTITQTVESAGLQVKEVHYFFITILPLLYLRHLLKSGNNSEINENNHKTISFHINPVINKLLLVLTRLENRLSKWLPNIAGGSLLLVATRNPTVKKKS